MGYPKRSWARAFVKDRIKRVNRAQLEKDHVRYEQPALGEKPVLLVREHTPALYNFS